MVTRLLVVLLCFSCGISVSATSQTSLAQDVVPKAKKSSSEFDNPIRSSEKSKSDTQEEETQEAAKQESVKKIPDTPKTDKQKPVKSADEKQKTSDKVPESPDSGKIDSAQSSATKSEPSKKIPNKPESLQEESGQEESKQEESEQEKTSKSEQDDPEAAEVEEVKPFGKADVLNKPPAILSENLLPASTKFWVSIPSADKLEKQFDQTQIGMLAKDPAIKPFIDSLRDQAKELMNDKNVHMGIEFDDVHGIHSGEICVAGVLPDLDGKQQVKGSHGLVVLFDIEDTQKEAKELQAKINAQLKKRGAEIEEKSINGVAITKATLKQQKPVRNSRSNFQAIVGDWMLICDNESIFREVLRRLAAPEKIQKAETLASVPSFQTIMERTDLEQFDSQIRWFVDPFGYIELAQALSDEKRGDLTPRDDWSRILKEQGLGAFKGVGGNIGIATGEHELLHRTFTYAPKNQSIKNNTQVFKLFNFSGNEEPLEPAKWVPENASAFIVGNWQFSDALSSVGGFWDAFMDEEGAFKRTLNDFKVDPDMQLDITKLVGLLNNRITIVSAVERPITENSERVVIGIPIKGEPDFIFQSLRRATDGQVIDLGGINVIEVDSAARDEEFEEDDIFNLPGEEPIEEEEDDKPAFQLFAKRYFVVHSGHLLVANNKNYLRKLLAKKESKLNQAHDYIHIQDAIAKLSDDDKVCWRHFGRIDRSLEANYEMLRRGEMAKSQTVLARLINQIFAKQAADKAEAEGKKLEEDLVRQQKLDGSKLPADYAKNIAPYFGPMGWVMETENDGWRITGCVIKKKGMTEVVQKTSDEKKAPQQR